MRVVTIRSLMGEATIAFAERLARDLNNGASFEEAVKRFSRSRTAENGGQSGWFAPERLPAAMIPASMVQLDTMPLTANGKIDREALPDSRPGRPVVEEVYRAPRKLIEVQLADLWRKVLRIQRVGIDDNFFDLGGDSITAIQIVAKANDAGIPLTTHQLFRYQTVADLAIIVQDSAPINTGEGALQDATNVAGKQRQPLIDRSMLDVDEKQLDKLAVLLKKS